MTCAGSPRTSWCLETGHQKIKCPIWDPGSVTLSQASRAMTAEPRDHVCLSEWFCSKGQQSTLQVPVRQAIVSSKCVNFRQAPGTTEPLLVPSGLWGSRGDCIQMSCWQGSGQYNYIILFLVTTVPSGGLICAVAQWPCLRLPAMSH